MMKKKYESPRFSSERNNEFVAIKYESDFSTAEPLFSTHTHTYDLFCRYRRVASHRARAPLCP